MRIATARAHVSGPAHRGGQDHAGEPDDALLRARRRADHAGRYGRRRDVPARAALADGHGAAGHLAVRWDHPGLDEATSSVDTRTEVLVQKAMSALRSDRTSFVIADRLSAIRDADLILVMEAAQIVEKRATPTSRPT